jgi:hypothetical protein
MIFLIQLIPVIISLVVSLTTYMLLREMQKQQYAGILSRQNYNRQKELTRSYKRTNSQNEGQLDFTKNHPLKTQLFAMVGGHQRTVERLLTYSVRNNPGRDEGWHYEKVIQDLIRDRR